jgi:hypothetical protein
MPDDRYQLPDPLITANIYCSGRLDEVLQRCLVPFLEEARRIAPSDSVYLWTMRYPRGGEHLKVRLHAPPPYGAPLGDALAQAAAQFLATLVEPTATGASTDKPDPAPKRDAAPSIDREDEASHPDRSFVPTTYQRSHVSLGAPPFLLDDRYAARVTYCLGQGCQITLNALGAHAAQQVPFRIRQTTLLKTIVGALAGAGWSPEQRIAYLAYHRNWLIRFLLAKTQQGNERVTELLAQFAQNVTRLGQGMRAIEQMAAAQWARPQGTDDTVAPADAWRRGIHDLALYVSSFADRPEYRVDPFARDQAFAAVFKVLHGLANQLGLKPFDESFAHHLLLHAAGGGQEGFEFEPPA